MKVIFLDIDGVVALDKQFYMNRAKFHKKHPAMTELGVPYPWDVDACNVLNEILDATGAVIVLSSDWRLHWNLDDLKGIFTWNGVKKSPIAVTDNNYRSFTDLERERAGEIGSYVEAMGLTNYVVIDDLNIGKFMTYTNDQDKFFMTKSSMGLKQTGLKDKIINKLNNVS